MFDPFKKLVGIETKTERCREQAIKAGVNPDSVATLSEHSGTVGALVTLPDGRLASGSWDTTVRVWSVSKRGGVCEVTLTGHTNLVQALTVLSDGRLASGSSDKTIRVWNVRGEVCEVTLTGHTNSVNALTVLPDGRLVSGSSDNTIRVWIVSKRGGFCEVTLTGHTNSVHAVTVLPDGRLASGSSDKTIRVWSVRERVCEVTLRGCMSDMLQFSGVKALIVLPDGRLASGSSDNMIRVWNVSKREGVCEVTLMGHKHNVAALAVLPDGRLASGAVDNRVRVWNVSKREGVCEVVLREHTDYVLALAVLPDGRLVSSAGDRTIRVWDVGLRLAPSVAATSTSNTRESNATILPNNTNRLIEDQKIQAERRLAEERKIREVQEAARQKSEQEAEKRQEEEQKQQAQKAQAEKHAQEQKAREAQEAKRLEEERKKQEQEERVSQAREELAKPENQRQQLRQIWEAQAADEILKAYEVLILQAPKESANYRERGAFYIYNAEKARSNLQKSRLYESARQDFKTAVDLNAWDDLAAEQHDYVTTQLEQLRLLNSPQKITVSTLSSHSSTEIHSVEHTTPIVQEDKNTPITVFNLPSLYISADKIMLGKELGRGGFGTVYAGQYNFQTVAVKRYEGMHLPERVAAEVLHEVEVMLKLQHECLVRLLGLVQIDSHPAMIVMEYGANGSLYNYLHSTQEITWSLRLRIAKELARGLAYLHQEKIIHRDIKSLNVVLNEDYHAKWCDFGLAVLKLHSTTTTKQSSVSAAGTDRWKAPELFTGEASHSVASDIWALGMIYFELASRQVPFYGAEGMQLGFRIVSGNPKGEAIPADCLRQAPKFAELMQRCWQDRATRPSAIELVQALETMTVVANKTQPAAISHNDSDVTPSFNPYRK